jgi:PAS domain S-box-containing protein
VTSSGSREILGLGLEEVVRDMPAAVVIVEAPSGAIIHSNARAREMAERQLGRDIPDALTGDWEIFHPDGRPYRMEEWPLVRSITSGEKVVDEEYFNVLRDGSRLFVGCSSAPIHGTDGEIVAGVLVMTDVTEQKRREEHLAYLAGLLDNTDDAIVALDPQWYVTVWSKGAERMYGWTADEVLGRHTLEVARLEMAYEERADVRAAAAEQGRWRGDLVAYRKDGTPIPVELAVVALRDDEGKITGFLGIHRDVSERRRAAEERESRTRQQALVAELGLRALAADDLQAVMDDAVSLVAQTLDVELAGVGELAPGHDEVIFRAGVGWGAGVVGRRIGRETRGSLLGYTLRFGKPVISEDMAADGRFNVSAIAREHGAVSALSVMIATPDEPFGTLGAMSTRRRAFTEFDVGFVQSVANVLASAVERTRAQRRLSQVRETERRRLARALHDEALQELTLALAEAQRRESSGAEPDGAERLVPALKRVGQQLRGAIYDLRLEEEEGRPFRHLLEALVALHGAMAVDYEIELDLGGGVPRAPLGRRGSEILRLVGEALTNARRHSDSQSIRVAAWGSEEHLCVEIADQGRGFDPDAEPSGSTGAGIAGMRERAALLDADLDIRSKPGEGTRVRLGIPLGEGRRGERTARVLLVEDHAAVRQAIAAMFDREPDFEMVGQAGTLAQARGMLRDVDVAVVDLGLPDGYGGDLIKELADVNPRAQALVLSATLNRAEVARAIESGAAGTLDKSAQLDEVVGAVRRLRAGETLMPMDEVVGLLRLAGHQREREQRDRAVLDRLTPREHEVLQALAEGLDSQAVADRLRISIRTERNHVASILGKLEVHSQLQALVFALRHGVVEIR